MPRSESQIFVALVLALVPEFLTSITTSAEIISVTEVDPLTGQNLNPVADPFNESLKFNFSDNLSINLENFAAILAPEEDIALKIAQEEIAAIVAYLEEVAALFFFLNRYWF